MMDRCTWYTTFETTKGDIQLSLQKGDFGQYFVLLKYYDKINTDTSVRRQWTICSILFMQKKRCVTRIAFSAIRIRRVS